MMDINLFAKVLGKKTGRELHGYINYERLPIKKFALLQARIIDYETNTAVLDVSVRGDYSTEEEKNKLDKALEERIYEEIIKIVPKWR